jgi:hypothetical protein
MDARIKSGLDECVPSPVRRKQKRRPEREIARLSQGRQQLDPENEKPADTAGFHRALPI